MKRKIFYSINNGGDGSAYPIFLESQELAEWDQDHMWGGWGESCDGSITIESDSAIFCEDVISIEDYFKENVKGEEYEEEFIEQFFPDGLPEELK